MVERILELMTLHKVTASKLTAILNLESTTVSVWKAGKAKPRTEHIIKLADFFNVSTDYLLTGKEPLPPDVTAYEMELLKKLRSLPPEKRKTVETLLNQL